LTHLSVVDGFEANPGGKRGFRVGIDASIWFFHAAYGKEGENPELRTLFFRCATLMRSPFLPLFVFDGPKRPSVKRGKRIGKNNHWLTTGMKNIIDAFGFEWRTVSVQRACVWIVPDSAPIRHLEKLKLSWHILTTLESSMAFSRMMSILSSLVQR
jgi:hypothetical protein